MSLQNAIAILLCQQGLDGRPIPIGRRNEENGACFVHDFEFNLKSRLAPALFSNGRRQTTETSSRQERMQPDKERNNMGVILHSKVHACSRSFQYPAIDGSSVYCCL